MFLIGNIENSDSYKYFEDLHELCVYIKNTHKDKNYDGNLLISSLQEEFDSRLGFTYASFERKMEFGLMLKELDINIFSPENPMILNRKNHDKIQKLLELEKIKLVNYIMMLNHEYTRLVRAKDGLRLKFQELYRENLSNETIIENYRLKELDDMEKDIL